jgi:NAD(P)H-quinone oxidoreductase subunit 4L
VTDLVNLQSLLILSTALFCIGLYGLLTRHNAVAILMSIELMLNAANINLVAFSRYTAPRMVAGRFDLPPQVHQYVTGQVFAIFVITLAAAEVAVGLAIIVAMYRHRHNINVDDINLLKW